MTIDEAIADFRQKEAAFRALLAQFQAEQSAGRTGLDQYKRAKLLSEELTVLGITLTAQIEEALASL